MKKAILNPILVTILTLIYTTVLAPALISAPSTELVIVGLAGLGVMFFYIYKAIVFFIRNNRNENH